MFKMKFLQKPAILVVLSTLIFGCNSAANNNQNTTPQYQTFAYSKVGTALSSNYTVNNLFVSGSNVYLTLSDQDESTFGYAKISKIAVSSDKFQTVYLTTPKDHQYSLIGDMVVNQNDSTIYVPVAYVGKDVYNYTWLKYESDATTSLDNIGNYSVSNELSSQFALKSATFSNGVIYANYAGNLIGFSENSSKELFNENNLLLSWQDSFSVEENEIIAIDDSDSGLVSISLSNKNRSAIGEDFIALANKGFEAMPKFAIYNHRIYILAIHRSGNAQTPYLALCSINDTAIANDNWDCKVSTNSLTTGNRLINLDVDRQTGKIYFIAERSSGDTQLYVINQN